MDSTSIRIVLGLQFQRKHNVISHKILLKNAWHIEDFIKNVILVLYLYTLSNISIIQFYMDSHDRPRHITVGQIKYIFVRY